MGLGAADPSVQRFHPLRYPVGFHTKSAANTSEQVGATTIVGAATDSPEVQLVAGFFVDPQTRGDDRTDGTVDVLLGDSYSGFNDDAPTSIDVPGGVICIPGATEAPADGNAG